MTVAVRQGSEAWHEARRSMVTATDIPVLLGISPWKCEADLADEKRGLVEPQAATLRMRAGTALQPLIGEGYAEKTGKRIRAWPNLAIHPTHEWAGASPDFRVVGEKRLVEAKRSSSRGRFADGLPQDIEAQVQWQLGVTGYPVADVAVLLAEDELSIFEVAADPVTFDNLVAVAWDFRKRVLFGGSFSRDTARIKRDHPADDGSEMLADADLTQAVKALVDTRTARKRMEASEVVLEDAIKARMGPVARLIGDGFTVSWKRTKDREETDWRSLAAGLLRQLPESERTALVGIHTDVREGFRPFRVQLAKEDPE